MVAYNLMMLFQHAGLNQSKTKTLKTPAPNALQSEHGQSIMLGKPCLNSHCRQLPRDRPAQTIAWVFITEFLKSTMRVRLAAGGSLKPVDIQAEYLGAICQFEQGGRQFLDVQPYAQFKGDKSTANWLPDGDFSRIWQGYGKTTPVKRWKLGSLALFGAIDWQHHVILGTM